MCSTCFDGLTKAIYNRRSIRSFKDEPVPLEDLKKLVEFASWAPSGSNAQAWHFIVFNDKSKIKKFVRFSPGLFEVPPAIIFVCTDILASSKKAGKLGTDNMSVMDSAMAAQNIMLSAYAMGYGTCALKGFDADAVSHLMRLPENIRIDLLIILGAPNGKANPPKRNPVENIMHIGGWEQNAD